MDDDDGRLMMLSSLESTADANHIILVGVKMCYFCVPRDTHADSSLLGGLEGGTRMKCTSIAVGQIRAKNTPKTGNLGHFCGQ
jgi:hypothetical protein